MTSNKQIKNSEVTKLYDDLIIIETFLDGMEVAAENSNLRENVYKVKQHAFSIRGFLLRLMD